MIKLLFVLTKPNQHICQIQQNARCRRPLCSFDWLLIGLKFESLISLIDEWLNKGGSRTMVQSVCGKLTSLHTHPWKHRKIHLIWKTQSSTLSMTSSTILFYAQTFDQINDLILFALVASLFLSLQWVRERQYSFLYCEFPKYILSLISD